MVKKIYLFSAIMVAFCLSMASCINDDKNEVEIDEVWKALNDKRFNEALTGGGYSQLSSQSGNGKVLWKSSDEIKVTPEETGLRMTVDRKPEFTDTVVVRYEGWYLSEKGEKVIFDSSENPSMKSEIDYSYGISPDRSPNKTSVTYAVKPVTSTSYSNKSPIDGTSTVIQDMKAGEEREICIPQALAYGAYGVYYVPSVSGASTYTMVPGYTTVWFRIKLLRIIPMSGRSS